MRVSLTLLLVLLSACAADPVIPPTPLGPIKAEKSINTAWRVKVGESSRGQFEPLVLGNTVYSASREGVVAAFDAESGKRVWRRDLEMRLGSGIAGAGGVLYVSSDNGVVLALKQENGSELWQKGMSSEVLTPVSSGFESVLVRSADGRIAILEAADGSERWSTSYTPPALTLNGYSRPLLLDGGVLVGLDDGRLLALNSANGREIWESVVSLPSGRSEVERLADIDGAIRVDDNAIYAVSYQGNLARIEPSRGQIVWSVPMSSTAGMVIVGDVAIVATDKGSLQAVNKNSGQLLWTQDALVGRTPGAPARLDSNHVVVGDIEGYLHVVSLDDGRLVGRKRVSKEAILPELVTTESAVYAQSADGQLVRFSLAQ